MVCENIIMISARLLLEKKKEMMSIHEPSENSNIDNDIPSSSLSSNTQIANMSATGLSLSPERLEDMDVSEYLYLDEMSAAFKRPVLQSDIAGFLKPYSLLVGSEAGVSPGVCLYLQFGRRWINSATTFQTIDRHL